MDIKIPGLKEDLGLGDVVKKVASAVGIEQKEGCGCKERQRKLNELLRLKGLRPVPEPTPEPQGLATKVPGLTGYRALDACDGAVLYHNGRTYQIISRNPDGSLRASGAAGRCCSGPALEEFKSRCQSR